MNVRRIVAVAWAIASAALTVWERTRPRQPVDSRYLRHRVRRGDREQRHVR